MVAKIAETLDLDTLMYQRLDDLVEAIGLPKEKLCTHCWDGSSYYD
jgi:amidophosphoribosyltransferase